MPYKKPLYAVLAQHLLWQPPAGSKFVQQRQAEIKRCLDLLPSGSGWDEGTKIDMAKSTRLTIVLYGSYHHMDSETGAYDGWTEHEIKVVPSLAFGFTLTISGRDRNDIKDYIHEMFDCALRQEIDVYTPYKELSGEVQ